MRREFVAAILAASVSAATIAPAVAGGARVIAAPAVGCVDRALIERAYWLQTDPGLDYNALMRAAFGAGDCRALGAGLVVVVEHSDILGNLARVRPVGQPQAVWIFKDALADGRVEFPEWAGRRFLPPLGWPPRL